MSQDQEERRFRIAQPGRFMNNSKEQMFKQFIEKLAVCNNDLDVEIQVVQKNKGTGNPAKPVKAIEVVTVAPEVAPGPSKKKPQKVKITRIIEPSCLPSLSGHILHIDSDEDSRQDFGRYLSEILPDSQAVKGPDD
ncbi:uncharacterized protein FIBRA_09594 [Fibroporia radiculosa]|uniref:Uncharacterized protein n=1 Tax=Fibroporia radiculosa TaxID=599839 RepID=J7SD74_9APHY|nr:uncharacterized protein FIBRA_09594 [Fibroporia radiculosa]CCM07248.1 predicted protein [Fibroporia radiculosa]